MGGHRLDSLRVGEHFSAVAACFHISVSDRVFRINEEILRLENMGSLAKNVRKSG
jgi:hypothetical protein